MTGHVDLIADLPDLSGAVCVDADPELWFSDLPAELARACALCRSCPVRVKCLAGAVDRDERWGIWGGEVFPLPAVCAREGCRVRLPLARTARRDRFCSMACRQVRCACGCGVLVGGRVDRRFATPQCRDRCRVRARRAS